MSHVFHLLEEATSEIDFQATPRIIVLADNERWSIFIPANDVHVVAIYLHDFGTSQVMLLFPAEIIFSHLVRLALLADEEVSPDAPLIEYPDAR